MLSTFFYVLNFMKERSSLLKGIILVSIGASSYGILATIAKSANLAGYKTGEIVLSQVILGLIGVIILHFFWGKNDQKSTPISLSERKRLIIFGSALGLTSTFYYLSIRYMDVTLAIIFLMQSIWMGVVWEAIREKQMPTTRKIIAAITILIGTALTVNVLDANFSLPLLGILYGLLSAFTYTATIYISGAIAPKSNPATKSMYSLTGSAITCLIIWAWQVFPDFQWSVIPEYSIYLAIFGTVIPPVLFAKGMPITGIGLGSILSSLEIPVSVICAWIFLGETLLWIQITGIILIMISVVVMNLNFKQKNAFINATS